jgi:hypothetical protein
MSCEEFTLNKNIASVAFLRALGSALSLAHVRCASRLCRSPWPQMPGTHKSIEEYLPDRISRNTFDSDPFTEVDSDASCGGGRKSNISSGSRAAPLPRQRAGRCLTPVPMPELRPLSHRRHMSMLHVGRAVGLHVAPRVVQIAAKAAKGGRNTAKHTKSNLPSKICPVCNRQGTPMPATVLLAAEGAAVGGSGRRVLLLVSSGGYCAPALASSFR